jgi:hypothetical protein
VIEISCAKPKRSGRERNIQTNTQRRAEGETEAVTSKMINPRKKNQYLSELHPKTSIEIQTLLLLH